MHEITYSLVLIALLAVAVLITILLFRKVRPLAALLLVPYLAWVLFATWLNYEFKVANPNADGREVSGATQRIEI